MVKKILDFFSLKYILKIKRPVLGKLRKRNYLRIALLHCSEGMVVLACHAMLSRLNKWRLVEMILGGAVPIITFNNDLKTIELNQLDTSAV